MFPYISPELSFGGEGHYLIELDFANKYNINKKNYKEKLKYLFNRMDTNYLEYNCPDKKCDWHKWCKRIKWIWFKDIGKSKKEGKLKSYCEMKKAINSAYYDALVK
ncbi:hypothetical protein KAI65_04790 [Candidatus Parcubacteria bacterium]|nr:hypothetical protein [Candidatus Parcubacteria bacterium]